MIVELKRLSEKARIPSGATPGSSGYDVYACIDGNMIMKPGEVVIVPTGIAIEMTPTTECQVRPRSGLAAKHGVTVLNAPGTIDADYRGEIKVILVNHGKEDFVITPNMRIAQLVFCNVLKASFAITEMLTDTQRADGGFGSTGQ
jgi:dUTP pyrophosphatase